MSTLTLYHGSGQIVEVPDFAFGNDHNDYGNLMMSNTESHDDSLVA